MKAESYKYAFDKRAAKLATLSPDGRLRIWETSSGKLCHEWTPSPNLQTTCCCLCWTNNAENTRPRPKKDTKKKSTSYDDESKSNLTFGTMQGSVILLDTNLEVKNALVTGHNERVTDVCYSSAREAVYSGSNDKYIIEWSYPSMSIKSKWKADKHVIGKLEVSLDGSCLLTAGRSIKLWDLETKQLLQKFTGHVNPVTSLLFVPVSNARKSNNQCYFLSTAEEDQITNAWHYDPSSPENGAVSCFMTPGDPVAADVLVSEVQQIQLGVACLDGRVNIFKHVLNGRLTKPINSSLNVQLVKQNHEKMPQESIGLLSLKLIDDDSSVMLVYGSPIRPTFEKIPLASLEDGSTLKREVANNFCHGDSNSVNSTKKQRMAMEKIVAIDSNAVIKSKAAKERRPVKGEGELTLEERLNASSASVTKKTKSGIKKDRPNAGSLAQMLNQALHSDDDKLIDNVLFKANKVTVITTTVKRMSTSAVLTLINKVVERIQKNPSRGYELTVWIRVLMNVHMTYLISMPNLAERLNGLYQLLESRTKVYPKLSKLHGRLNLILTHATPRKDTAADVAHIREPLMTFEDKESEEENETEDIEQLIMSHESDENGDDSDEDVESMNESSEKDHELLSENELESDMEDV